MLMGLVTVACGSRMSDEDLAIARAGRGAGSGSPTETTFLPGQDTGSPTETTTASGEPGSSGENGAGDTPGESTDGSTPVASGGGGGCKGTKSSDVGVTPTQIKVGQIVTATGPVPGFGETGRAALRAFIAYINSQGGVCGRQLVMVPGDDGLEAGRNRSETSRIMKQVFAFVSNTSVADDGGAVVLEGTNVPSVGLSTSKEAGSLPTNFSPSPVDYASGRNGTGKLIGYLKQKYGVETAGLVWPAQPIARTAAERYKNDLKDQGVPVEVEREVAVTETNFSGVASAMQNADVDLVLTTLEFNAIARLARAFDTQGWFPKVPFYGAQTYGKKFLDVAGEAANGTKLGIGYEVFESRASVPEVDLFLDWYTRVNPGKDVDFFAIMAWTSARMFVDALVKTGPEPTRDAFLKQMATFTDYTANNFLGHINPAQKKNARCFVVVEVRNQQWVKTHPKGPGFQC